MAYIQLMGTRNELAAIPEGRCGFQSEQIRCGGDGEHHPSAKRIPEFEFFHCCYYCLYYVFIIVCTIIFNFVPSLGQLLPTPDCLFRRHFCRRQHHVIFFCTFVVPTSNCLFRWHFCRRQHHVVFFCTFVVPTPNCPFRRHFCRRQHRAPTAQRSRSKKRPLPQIRCKITTFF